MLPITQIPEDVSDYCFQFHSLFTLSEYQHFQKYLTGLFVVDRINISAINGQFVDSVDQSTLNRFLTDSNWDREEFNRRRIEILQSDPRTRSSKKGNLILDDTLFEKHGPKIEWVGKLKDPSSGKYLPHAHNLVTSIYADSTGRQWPFDLRFYIKEGLLPEKERKTRFKTKVRLATELIDSAVEQGINFQFVLIDCWYLCPEFVKATKKHYLHYIAESRRNRKIWNHDQQQYIKLGEYLESDEFAKLQPRFQIVTVANHRGRKTTYRYDTDVCRFQGLGKLRVIFTQRWYPDKDGDERLGNEVGGWSKIKILVTDAIDNNPVTLIRRYALRWDIEVFHRDEKQSFGFGEYRLRGIEAIRNHWCLVLAAYTLAQTLRVSPSLMRNLKTQLSTIGTTVRYVKEQVLHDFITFLYGAFEQQTSVPELLAMFKIINPTVMLNQA